MFIWNQDGVGQIEVEETNLMGRGAGGVVCRASHKPTGERNGTRHAENRAEYRHDKRDLTS